MTAFALHLWKYFRWSWTKLRRVGIPISCKVDVVEYLVFLTNSTTFLISMVSEKCVTVNILLKQYTTTKPAPAGIEFLQLVEIIMEEEDWPMPSNYEEALDLYINLLNEME